MTAFEEARLAKMGANARADEEFEKWLKTKPNEIFEINKEVWIPGIKKEIAEWERFSESIFCEKEEDKQNALNHANELRKFLELVETNTLTKQQFEHYLFSYFW